MEIMMSTGTNAKGEHVKRFRVEISDKELFTIDGNPDDHMRPACLSRNSPNVRLSKLAELAFLLELANAPKSELKPGQRKPKVRR